MAISEPLVEFLGFFLEPLAPFMPGDTFPAFFELEMFHRALIAAFLVTIVAGFYGSFLLMRNLALMGDGLAHVSFGGVAIPSLETLEFQSACLLTLLQSQAWMLLNLNLFVF